MIIKTKWYNYLILVITSLLFITCGDDTRELTKQQKVTKLLIQDGGAWEPGVEANAITVEGLDAKELFPGFVILFTANQITTSGTSPIWPASDTWSFKDKNADVIIRASDDREITIVEISSTQLIIEMEWDKTTFGSGGRAFSLSGKYSFTLTK